MNALRTVSLLGCLVLGATLAASSIGAADNRRPPDGLIYLPRSVMRVSLDVLVDGSPVRLISHQGRLYLPVPRMGAEYEIRVNNHGPRRITAIVSVDDLAVLDGRPATELGAGYLVDSHTQIIIKGWRRDSDTVAAFTFEERERSYAARMGYSENIGVIGLVAFEEMEHRPSPILERRDAAPLAGKSARAELGGSGTGWGRDIDSRVYKVPFVRSANKRTITIYYDTKDALRRAGVPVDGGYPTPFPGGPEYAPPPPLGLR